MIAQVFVFKLTRIEIAGARCGNNGIRCRDSLQAGGNIRRLAYDGAFLRSAFSNHVTDDDRPCRNTDPYRELDYFAGIVNGIEFCDRTHKRQSGVK